MRAKKRSRFIYSLCVALLLALALSAPAEALLKVCMTVRCCHQCDYFSNDGTWLYGIYWCWTDSGSGCAN
jgi:hypothetical protein